MSLQLNIVTTYLDGLVFGNSDIESEDDDITSPKQHFSTTEKSPIPDGCIKANYTALGYIPWDNQDNILSEEAGFILDRVNQNILALMVLIGVPANVINMAVFSKQSLKDRVNLCLFALSLSDVLYVALTTIFRYGEQVITQFTSEEKFGPVTIFSVNHNLSGVFGFHWVSQVLSAIIASERCFCVLSPLKFQTLFSTTTMAVLIIAVYIVVVGLFFIIAFLYRIACVYDAVSGAFTHTYVAGELYKSNKDLVDYLNVFVFGSGLPVAVILVVTTTTIITTIKLRQIVTWRAGTTSSLSAREVALTKMLIANSIFFIACVTPDAVFRVACFFLPEMSIGGRNHNLYLSFVWLLDSVTYVNSSFNMFLFYAMGSRFRETFWALFKRKRQRDKDRKLSTTAV